jgi:hypothetical protein
MAQSPRCAFEINECCENAEINKRAYFEQGQKVATMKVASARSTSGGRRRGMKLRDVRGGQAEIVQDFALNPFDHRPRASDQQEEIVAGSRLAHLLEYALQMRDLRLGCGQLAVVPDHSWGSPMRESISGVGKCNQEG